jgi:hypothetical protein
MTRRTRKRRPGRGSDEPLGDLSEPRGQTVQSLEERLHHPEANPSLSGGDVDADWERAYSSGDEAVGGSVATPDQDVVDEIGHALGVEQPPDGEVRTSEEILKDRDRHYWHLERRATEEDDA